MKPLTEDTKLYFEALGCYTVTIHSIDNPKVRDQILKNQEVVLRLKKLFEVTPIYERDILFADKIQKILEGKK